LTRDYARVRLGAINIELALDKNLQTITTTIHAQNATGFVNQVRTFIDLIYLLAESGFVQLQELFQRAITLHYKALKVTPLVRLKDDLLVSVCPDVTMLHIE
jgi:hypothetical protein